MQPPKKITLTTAAEFDQESREKFGSYLYTYNRLHLPDEKAVRLQITAKDEKGEVVGGIYGHSCWGWLEIAVLVVKESHRKTGLGTMLMKEAEEEAVRRGTPKIRLNTFSFQAPDFYKRLGYKVIAIEEGFPEGCSTIHFHKLL